MKQQNVGLTVNLRLGLYLGSGCWLLDGMWAKPSKFCESSGLSAEASSIIQAFFCRCKGGQPLQVPLAGAWSTPNFSKLSKVWVEFACRHWKSTFSLQATAIFRSGSHDTCTYHKRACVKLKCFKKKKIKNICLTSMPFRDNSKVPQSPNIGKSLFPVLRIYGSSLMFNNSWPIVACDSG